MEELINQLLNSPTAKGWSHVGARAHHGIDISLSALRSQHSSGIGEFHDLLPIIDWCSTLKIDVIQLLPLNNSDHDPSPYYAIHSCAINFIYLSLHALPHLNKLHNLKKQLKDLAHWNDTPRIAFTEVLMQKLSWLHAYFDAVGAEIIHSKECKQFIEEHAWVQTYALYRTLKDRLGHTPWQSWPPELQCPDQKEREELIRRYFSEVAFYVVLQFLCYSQLKMVKEYAGSKGVLLMGDIPIMVSDQSADVWQFPQYFELTLAAGAPPDMYNPDGQYWGFPIFRWDAMRKDHYSWWKSRLAYARSFYDLFRIDHVIGFFRIWAIPLQHPAKEGHFLPTDEAHWATQGTELLSTLISFADGMLPIAEDLGLVPDVLPPTLKEFGICGTKVMRWERNWKEDKSFIPFQYYPPLSLTCVSTHDSETLTLWWRDFPEEAQEFARFKRWEYTPELSTQQRMEILWDSHHTPSFFHINLLQEYLAIFPELIWPHPEDERINIPGKILPTNWTYRYKATVEEIVQHSGLAQAMEKILFSPSPLM